MFFLRDLLVQIDEISLVLPKTVNIYLFVHTVNASPRDPAFSSSLILYFKDEQQEINCKKVLQKWISLPFLKKKSFHRGGGWEEGDTPTGGLPSPLPRPAPCGGHAIDPRRRPGPAVRVPRACLGGGFRLKSRLAAEN